MTPLGRVIADAIRADGPMRLDRYMALCLSHPVHGYYATRDPFGAQGDFVTAPEISQMFGELLGLWAAEVWRLMGAPPRILLVEIGPGRGTLMADMLRAGRVARGFLNAADVVLVETSPALRDVQVETLQSAGVPVRWAGSIEETLPPPRQGAEPARPAIVVSNEFFDALPIRQFVRNKGGWREKLIGLDDRGALAFGLSAEPLAGLDLPDAPAGAVREVCEEALAVAARIGAHVATHGGACLAIDYGYAAGAGDTLQAVKAHAFTDPLAEPGEADLTAHVDFAALAAAASRAGAAPMRLLSQADFLERLGIAARARRLVESAAPESPLEAAARLTDRRPRGMGALFKALAFGDPRLPALPGFERASAPDA
ncbi:SAM-dependent methyltransferase [Methylopila sp. M107]|uniref:class I SAM-dependent methyltransferase n=1 Tax=Methylopila sp. M107 TaxID=1101190 RepID=UPI00035F5ABD|nr:SAM-dependent methyltransferase [Methylopila sp. M107]